MGFARRMATTWKVEISEEVRKEVETTYLYSIVSIMENNKIPKAKITNLDQTPSKYVPGCNKTLAPKGIKSVSVAGSTDKRTITATFSITKDGKFLPIQIIYGGKTSKSILPVSFPDSFLVSANKKHYSKEKESLKMLVEHIIIPYVKKATSKSQSQFSVTCLADHGYVQRPDDEKG